MKELRTRSDAIEFLLAEGFHAFARDWSLGESIGVAAEPFEHQGITAWRRMVYIAPRNDGWEVYDLSKPGQLPAPAASLEHACRAAVVALQAQARSHGRE